MDSKYLQQQRFQLQKRFRNMNSCSHVVFHSATLQLWDYLHRQPLFQGILLRLKAESPSYMEEIAALSEGTYSQFTTEAEFHAFVFRVVEHCCAEPLSDRFGPELKIGHGFATSDRTHDAALDKFREMFLEPFYEYLDEALDNQLAVVSVLLKYKRKVEWFERSEVAALEGNERALATHLYAYLFDQGLDFHIEPSSASGEADLVAKDLVLDAKVFDGGRRGLTYLTHGVHQVHTYAQDYNQTVGYLVVYKTCPETLHFAVPSADDLVPHVTAAGKTIYLLCVDICEHANSASKRGVLKTFSLDEAALVRAAVEPPLEEDHTD